MEKAWHGHVLPPGTLVLQANHDFIFIILILTMNTERLVCMVCKIIEHIQTRYSSGYGAVGDFNALFR
jgi:hypothetical protein